MQMDAIPMGANPPHKVNLIVEVPLKIDLGGAGIRGMEQNGAEGGFLEGPPTGTSWRSPRSGPSARGFVPKISKGGPEGPPLPATARSEPLGRRWDQPPQSSSDGQPPGLSASAIVHG